MKAHYIGQLVTEYVNGKYWLLHDDFGFQKATGQIIMVPSGHKTDMASVPAIFRCILPMTGGGTGAAYGEAAVIHDWMCEHHILYSREAADKTFLEAMTVSRVSHWRRYAMYYAVRAYSIVKGFDRNDPPRITPLLA